MNITAIIYDADARRTAYILGTVIGNCKLFPAERAPRDWSRGTQTSSPSPRARTARS